MQTNHRLPLNKFKPIAQFPHQKKKIQIDYCQNIVLNSVTEFPKTYLVCAQTQLQIQRETQLKLHIYAHLCYQYQHVIQSLKKIKPTHQQKSK